VQRAGGRAGGGGGGRGEGVGADRLTGRLAALQVLQPRLRRLRGGLGAGLGLLLAPPLVGLVRLFCVGWGRLVYM
jgi:hypothetical protein